MVDITMLSPGTKVRIVDRWTNGCRENSQGLMDKWLGSVMTVTGHMKARYGGDYVYMLEDEGDCPFNGRESGHWQWFPAAIAEIVEDVPDITDDELAAFLKP